MDTFLKEIADSFQKDKPEWEKQILDFQHKLQTKGKRCDIEVVLTALCILADSSLTKNYLATFHAIPDIDISVRTDISDLLDEIRKKIYKICMGFNLSKAVDLYEKPPPTLERYFSAPECFFLSLIPFSLVQSFLHYFANSRELKATTKEMIDHSCSA
jgi:hypothetical protein